ncbi:MAG: hypothetical protein ACRD11_05255 [Terriglobia bacterium]
MSGVLGVDQQPACCSRSERSSGKTWQRKGTKLGAKCSPSNLLLGRQGGRVKRAFRLRFSPKPIDIDIHIDQDRGKTSAHGKFRTQGDKMSSRNTTKAISASIAALVAMALLFLQSKALAGKSTANRLELRRARS